MTDSNITSFDHRRRSLGELQRQVEQLTIETKKLKEYNDWQDMIIDTMEIQFTEFKSDYKIMNETLLDSIKGLHKMLFKLGDKIDAGY